MLVAMKILQYNIFEGVRDPTVDINGKNGTTEACGFHPIARSRCSVFAGG